MWRAAVALAVLGLLVGAALFVNSIASSDPSDAIASTELGPTTIDREVALAEAQHGAADSLDSAAVQEAEQQGSEHAPAGTQPTLASESVSRWISEATDANSTRRAVAIKALGAAPAALAVPILQKVFSTGAEDDRQLALNSLRTLALDQGDADGVIRDTLRLTVYDGDDYVVADAQAALEEIEHVTANARR